MDHYDFSKKVKQISKNWRWHLFIRQHGQRLHPQVRGLLTLEAGLGGPSSRLPLPPVTRPIRTGAPVLDTGTPRPTPTPLTKGFPVPGHVWCVWMELSFHIPHPSKFSSFIISTIATITLTMINCCIYLLVSTPRGWNNYILVISVSLVPTTNLSIYWVLHKCLLTIKWSKLTPHQALLQRRRQFSCAWFFPLWKHISLHAGHPLENGSL